MILALEFFRAVNMRVRETETTVAQRNTGIKIRNEVLFIDAVAVLECIAVQKYVTSDCACLETGEK
jgi:hypothetical protein